MSPWSGSGGAPARRRPPRRSSARLRRRRHEKCRWVAQRVRVERCPTLQGTRLNPMPSRAGRPGWTRARGRDFSPNCNNSPKGYHRGRPTTGTSCPGSPAGPLRRTPAPGEASNPFSLRSRAEGSKAPQARPTFTSTLTAKEERWPSNRSTLSPRSPRRSVLASQARPRPLDARGGSDAFRHRRSRHTRALRTLRRRLCVQGYRPPVSQRRPMTTYPAADHGCGGQYRICHRTHSRCPRQWRVAPALGVGLALLP